jgi:hypothetical protein
MVNTKFLCLQIEKHLNWKNHIEQMIPKLSAACYAIRLMVHISNINTHINLLCIFHSDIKYWIIFGGNISNSENILILPKKVARIMVGAQPRTLRRSLFKQLVIPPVPWQYILTLMNFIIADQENFQTNSSIHNINTRNKHNLHSPNAKPFW